MIMSKSIKITILALAFACGAHADWVVKPLDEFPPEEGSPAASFIHFLKAAKTKDVEMMKSYAGETKKFVIEKDPRGVEKLVERYGTFDFDRTILYEQKSVDEDGKAKIALKYYRDGEERKSKMVVTMKKYEDGWKLE